MSPARQRATAILERIKNIKNPIVVEVGVFVGALSQILLAERLDLHLIMVDAWGSNTSREYLDTNDFHANATDDQQRMWEKQAREVVSQFPGRYEIIKDLSVAAASQIDDASIDLVFIDADHSYKGCKDDIKAWEPKVKFGGWISGHDYENDTGDFKFGVTEAVNEYISATEKTLSTGLNYTWFTKR